MKKQWMKKTVYVLCVVLLMQLLVPGTNAKATEAETQNFGKGYVEIEGDTLEEDKYPSISFFSLNPEMSSGEELPTAYRSDQVSANDTTVSYLPNAFRNQGSYGACWTFSALGACEASLIRKGFAANDIDLSERHLAYYFYNKGETPDPKGGTFGDYNIARTEPEEYLNVGGNSALSMWHLASWCGPVAESVAPYSGLTSLTTDSAGLLGAANTTSMAYETDACHVQNIYKIALGDMSSRIAQKSVIKKLIMEYGALGMSYYSADEYNCREHDSYYNDTYIVPNHAIQVVGWDDAFPKENFVKAAPGDGAWLMKNSWGNESASVAERGCFWLSYYDASINLSGDDEEKMPYAYVFDAEPADNYGHIYQYDGDSGNACIPSMPSSYKMANRFTAGDGKGTWEILRAVGVGIAQSNVAGTVEIYKNLTDPAEDPTSGEKVLSQKFSLLYPGYHTIVLDEEVQLPDGCEFSVVFQFDQETGVFLSMDTAQSFVQFVTEENEGVSFLKKGNNPWGDLGLDEAGFGLGVIARIKAYTDSVKTEDVQALAISDEEVSVEEGSSVQISASAPEGSSLTWKSSNTSVATVTKVNETCARITGVIPGTSVITVSDGTNEKQCLVTVTAKVSDDATEDAGDSGNSGGTESDVGNDVGNTDSGVTDTGDSNEEVEEEVIPAVLTKLKLNRTSATLVDGKTLQLKATPTYSGENATDWMVYWKSSDTTVAKVTNYGKVTAVKPGKATITVYNGSVKAKCVVTVKPGKTTLSSVSLTSKGKAKLKWKKVDGVTGYVIYRATSENGTCKKVKTVKNGSTVTATLAAYTGSKPYYYKICAYKTISGKNVYGAYSEVKTCGPKQVASVKASAKSGKKIKLTWKKTSNASGYIIYRATSKNGTYKKIKPITKAKTVSYTDKSLKKGKKYYYKIRAYRLMKGKKVYGPYSAVVSAKAK